MACDTEQLRALIAAATPGELTLLRGADYRKASAKWGDEGEVLDLTWWGAKDDINFPVNAALIVAAVNNLEPLLSTNEALVRENERLREALKPFAEFGVAFRKTWPDGDHALVGVSDDGTIYEITLADCDIARQALEPSHDQGTQ